MPDQYDPKVAPRAPGRRETPADDPLAELAKIVHGRPTVASAAAAKGPSRSQPVNGAAANDLEAELLNDLQASFAAVRDALPVTPLAAPQPKPAPAAPIAAPSLRGPIVEDTPAAAAPPPASVTPPQPSPFRVPSPQAAAAQPAAPQPTPARTAAPRPDATPRPELRDEFRLEPINESRLVPIPSPPVIQPQIQQTSDYQPAARAERPSVPERRVEPGPIDEKPADAGVERAPRAARPATPPEPPSDLANFTIRTATRSAAAASAPAPLPGAARQPHSRWEKPEPPKPQPSAPSRFAPPKSAAAEDDADRDPFADAGLLPGEDGDAGLDAEFPLDGLGMVPGYGDDDDVDMLPPLDDDLDALAKPRGPRRGLMIAGAVVVVALIGGVAVAMFHSGSSSTSGGAPPVIQADNSPTKVVPKPDTADSGDTPNKLIYDRVNSADTNSSDDTTLVTSGDEPIKDVPSSSSSDNAISRVIIPGGATDTGASTAPADDGTQVATAETPDDALGPRKVRTVVVKPDGTIVSSQATDAPPPADTGAASASPSPPAVTTAPATPPTSDAAPAVPVSPPVVASNEVPTVAQPPVTDDTAAIAGEDQSGPLAITDQPGAPAPADSGAAAAGSASQAAAPPLPVPTPVAPKPTVKPTVKAPPANAEVADTTSPIDITPGTEPAAVPAGGVLVQVSSQRTEDAARATYKDLQERYPAILGRYNVNIQRADLGDRGIFYRVRVGPFPQADAQHLCDDLRSAGGDCVLTTK